ncbi:MAG: alkaline phosphatase family protein [bacterium]
MKKRLVLAVIDGCHRGVLYDLIDRGEARFLGRLAESGTRVREAVTMFPATTVCCCATLYTGCLFRRHGILNNEWVDRFAAGVRGRSYIAGARYALESLDRKFFGFPSILLPDLNRGGAINNDIGAPTIYEEFARAGRTSYAYFHYVGRGATRWVRPGRMDMLTFAYVEKSGKPYQIYERRMVSRAIRDVRREAPDLLSVYFGCNDGHSHRHGVAAQAEYLRDFVDGELERLSRALEERCPGDEIYWAVSADHGQTSLSPGDRDRSVFDHTFFPVLRSAGYGNVGRGFSDRDLSALDAVVTLGNGAAIGFYLRNRATRRWEDAPDFEGDVAPALNHMLKAAERIPPFEDWAYPGYLDFLLTRTGFEEGYRVYGNAPPYEGTGELAGLEEYFSGKEGEYVRPVERIRGIDHPKGPDVVMVLNYRDHFNVNEVENFHVGQHGGLNGDDSYVPMIFSGPGVKVGEAAEALTTDFAPTAAAMAGVEMPAADGRVLEVT